jgi:hypothetical protein
LIVSISPEHIGELLVIPIGGVGVTVALIVAETVHAPKDTTTVYTPDASEVAFMITGFCTVVLNELGPLQK